MTEQLRGEIRLPAFAERDDCRVELTLWFKPVTLNALMEPDGPRVLDVDSSRSRLRIFPPGPWQHDEPDNTEALLIAPLAGTLTLFRHGASTACQRRRRALHAWLWNRGIRDILQYFLDKQPRAEKAKGAPRIMSWLVMAFKLASRAGDDRMFEYELYVGKPTKDETGGSVGDVEHRSIRGRKHLAYTRAANPWQQLERMEIGEFPNMARARTPAVFSVNLPYFSKVKVPLARIVEQQDMPSALADLGAFGLYFLRMLIQVHVWTFRKPDAPSSRAPRRLPCVVGGLPPPEVTLIDVADRLPDGTRAKVTARLTRYRGGESSAIRPPVLLIHGYSASGTTFAHAAIPEGGLAGHLCKHKRDVWVLDLRSSAGMPTSRESWKFEEMGYVDIPLAVAEVVRATGQTQIDIVAHCMGVAMLCMGLLGDYGAAGYPDPCRSQREALATSIRRLVMSQVAPAMILAPANVLRAYLMRYLQYFLPLADYTFRPAGTPGPMEELIDRFLSSVPYPGGEFERENPVWPPGAHTPWVSVRHRIDALYGVSFKLANMSPRVLDHIDDFFGPLSARTVTQTIHFVLGRFITDWTGLNRFGDLGLAAVRLPGRMLHVIGTENGLVDFATAKQFKKFLEAAGIDGRLTTHPLEQFGHQDSLIGRDAYRLVFPKISQFLSEP